ncbi:LysE family translocator [Vineibacter terrae]|uniref:LysE family translocator n=1 Tax=Vineibacter terrae TaxID=2586908 RepID=UPI001C499FD9|nr:LysE family translocator [Vineibacter terrae]
MILDPQLLWLYLGAVALLILTPGPDTFLVASTSATHGVRAGTLAALGVFCGCLVHVTLATTGISALIAASPWAFGILKMAGAAYLCWLGVLALRDAWRGHALGAGTSRPAVPADRSTLGLFLRGAVTNALNPKAAVFFVAFLPQFVEPSLGHTSLQLALLGMIFNVPGTLYLIGLAAVSGRATASLRRVPWVRRTLDAVVGVFFIGLAAHMVRAQAK